MSYCENCGQYLSEKDAFCPNCGTKNTRFVEEPAPAAQEVPVYQEEEYVPEAPVYQEPAPVYDPRPEYDRGVNYAAEEVQPQRGLNVMAIVGMALSALGFSSIAGLIVSIIALKKANNGEFRNPLTGLAKAGVIVGAIMVGLGVLAVLAWIVYAIIIVLVAGGAAVSNGFSSSPKYYY